MPCRVGHRNLEVKKFITKIIIKGEKYLNMNEVKNHWKKWMYWFMLGLSMIIIYKILDNFTEVTEILSKFFTILRPFFIGIFIAYLFYLPCKKIEEAYKKSKNKIIRKGARRLSIITLYIIVFLLIIILFNVILPVVIESVIDLVNNIQGYFEIAISNYNGLPEDSVLKGELVKDTINNIQNIDIKQYFQLDKLMSYVISAYNIVTSLFDIFVSIVVSIYVLSERDDILKFLKKCANAMFKEKTYKNMDKYFNNSNEIFFKFIASQFLDAVVVGVLVTIALSIMGIKYAPLLGFFIGLFNMIPYVGAIIAVAISAVITLITGGLSQTIWMLIITIILQQIDANIINPNIIGQSLKVSPLLVIFAITVGGAYFGMLGMFLAVPVIAIIKIVIEDYIDLKLKKKQKMEQEGQA